MYECIECMITDLNDQDKIHKRLKYFRERLGTFGKTLVLRHITMDQPSKQIQKLYFIKYFIILVKVSISISPEKNIKLITFQFQLKNFNLNFP